jgi:hypothetical protein
VFASKPATAGFHLPSILQCVISPVINGAVRRLTLSRLKPVLLKASAVFLEV